MRVSRPPLGPSHEPLLPFRNMHKESATPHHLATRNRDSFYFTKKNKNEKKGQPWTVIQTQTAWKHALVFPTICLVEKHFVASCVHLTPTSSTTSSGTHPYIYERWQRSRVTTSRPLQRSARRFYHPLPSNRAVFPFDLPWNQTSITSVHFCFLFLQSYYVRELWNWSWIFISKLRKEISKDGGLFKTMRGHFVPVFMILLLAGKVWCSAIPIWEMLTYQEKVNFFLIRSFSLSWG